MTRRRRRQQPIPRSPTRLAGSSADLLLLDRFTQKDLEGWKSASADLDRLNRHLYFDTEPARLSLRPEIIQALQSRPAQPLEFVRWVRLVDHRWTLKPLSAAGSIRSFGGRFNLGRDVDDCAIKPFPALYIASDLQTAYRERYQMERESESALGLTAEELALTTSHSSVLLNGYIERVFDASDLTALEPLAKVLARVKMPASIKPIARRLGAKLGPGGIHMIRNAHQLHQALFRNWRAEPVQFGLPSPSQQFGEFVRAAGYEAIRYESTKNKGSYCLAVLVGNLCSDRTFVELADDCPPEVDHRRLDMQTADELAGWEYLDARARPAD